MSRYSEISPLPPMIIKPKLSKAEIEYNRKLKDFKDLNLVFTKLYSIGKIYKQDVIFFFPEELKKIVKLEDIDYAMIQKQISNEKLTSCGQGGATHILWETVKKIATCGGYSRSS